MTHSSGSRASTPSPDDSSQLRSRIGGEGVEPQADPNRALHMKRCRVIQHRVRHVLWCDQETDLGASKHDPLSAPGDQVAYDPQVLLSGVVHDDAVRQLLEDDTVHDGAVLLGWNEDFEPEVSQSRPVEVDFHDRCSAKKAKGIRAVSGGCVSGRIDNVYQWDADGVLQLGSDPVHGIRGEDQELGTGALEPPSPLGEVFRGLIPLLVVNESLDYGEIHAVEHDLRGGAAAPELVDTLVDPPVVLRAGNAAHATQNTDRLHSTALFASFDLLGRTVETD